MHIFLTVLLWVFLAFLALLILVLFLPVGVGVKINYDKPIIFFKVLFLKFQIYPFREKKRKKRKVKEKAQQEEKPQQSDEAAADAQAAGAQDVKTDADSANAEAKPESKGRKKLPVNLSFEKIFELISAAGGALKIMFKGIFITKIEIVYPVHSDDSAETAIKYGKTQAYFGGIAAALRNFFHLSFKSVKFIPDFTGEHKYKRYFYCNIWSTAFIMIVAAVYLLIALKREKII